MWWLFIQAEHRADNSHQEQREQLEDPCTHPYASPICREAAAVTGTVTEQGWEQSTSCCSLGSSAASFLGRLDSRAHTNPSCLSLAQPVALVMVLLQSTRLRQLLLGTEAGAPSAPSPPSLQSQGHTRLPVLHPHLPPPPPPLQGFTNPPHPNPACSHTSLLWVHET